MDHQLLDRRRLLASMAAVPLVAATPPAGTRHAQDFDELWETLRDRYCYMAEKAVDWAAVRRLFAPQAAATADDAGFARLVGRVLTTLYDPHTHLWDPPDGTPRYPPLDIDVVADPAGARVRAVRPGSAAAAAGIIVGDVVTIVGDEPVLAAARRLAPACQRRADPDGWRHALGQALAGVTGDGGRWLSTARSGRLRLTRPDTPDPPPLSFRREGDIGTITITSFADAAIIGQFDAALAALAGVRRLLIDVRGNGGGDTAVARPIMGRFTPERRAYATMRRRQGAGLGPAWTEFVDPRGPLWSGPVDVIVDRWSASMAEGFPMGMKAISGARIIGQPMMGLGAAVFPLRLDRSGIALQYSAEPVFDINGRPRDRLRPDVLVPDGEDALAAALRLLPQGG
jgi:carboxyl-terminal processing protease